MMENSTSPAVHSALPDIVDKPEDTPRSYERVRRFTSLGVLSLPLVLATMVTPISASRDVFPVAKDRTAFAEEAREEEWSSLLSDTIYPFEEASQVSDAEVANRTRLALLARQYEAGKLSIEEEARMAIVAERVRRLIPRIGVEDFEVLEGILEEAQRIESADIERRRRLGIE
jgi:hypothetical protein